MIYSALQVCLLIWYAVKVQQLHCFGLVCLICLPEFNFVERQIAKTAQ